MAGIALGVAALIVVLSVYNGFQKEVTERMLSVLGHVEIYDINGQGMADWHATAKAAFEDYITQGKGGWIGFHHASLLGDFDGYPMDPWFSELLGHGPSGHYSREGRPNSP